MSTALHIVLYGLVAATSPLALGATLVVLRSGHGRIAGIAFAIGVVGGQALVAVVLLALGTAWAPTADDEHQTLRGLFDVAFGLALLAAAWHMRRTRARQQLPGARRSPRTEALHARLERLGPVTALITGALLGIGGPKRLGVTFLAATDLAASDLSRTATLSLLVAYVLVATVLVWAPVAAYVVFTDRATGWLERRQAWVRAHEGPIVFVPSLVVGMVLVVGGAVEIATA